MPSFQKTPAMPRLVIQSEAPLTAYIGRVMRIWRKQLEEPIFTGYCVLIADPTQSPERMERLARSRIARMFWEQALRHDIQSGGIFIEAAFIDQAAAAEVIGHAKNGGLPGGFTMELERAPLAPEAASTRSEEDFLARMRALGTPRLPS